ncbi:hypothetical protein BST61_g9472 [Cercospora zeina]
MGLFSKLKPQAVDPVVPVQTNPVEAETEKGIFGRQPNVTAHETDSDDEVVDKNAQSGVQRAEIMNQVFSKKVVIMIYAMIWCLYFLDALEGTMTSTLTPYVTSSFQLHGLTAATSIMASLIGGIFKLPLAKIIDVWGRPQGYALMVGSMTIGMIMMAGCENVQTYAAAEVFNQLGGNGRSYIMGILVADTSSLKSRGFFFALIASPYIITVWCAGPFAQTFLNINWRWAFGSFAIITPVTSLPLFFVLMYYQRKAEKLGLLPRRKSGRTLMQSIKYYVIEYDLLGLLLLCAGLALILLPFNLYTRQAQGWRSPMITCMIVFGGILLIVFGLYEAYVAPVTCVPWVLLRNRTILGANILAAVLFIEFYIWNSFFYSFLQVVANLTITQSTYVSNIYSIGSCFWSFVAGIILYKTGGFKWQSLLFGLPVTTLGVGLMIYFRQPGVDVGWMILCQILIAFGGGTLVICEQVAGMAATTHNYVAIVLAIQGMSSQIGGAIGQTVASAIWQGNFQEKLHQYLPEETASNSTLVAQIYGDLATQLSFEVGSPTRDGIMQAYGEAQRLMAAAATGILALGFVAVFMWRKIDTRQRKQIKGAIF